LPSFPVFPVPAPCQGPVSLGVGGGLIVMFSPAHFQCPVKVWVFLGFSLMGGCCRRRSGNEGLERCRLVSWVRTGWGGAVSRGVGVDGVVGWFFVVGRGGGSEGGGGGIFSRRGRERGGWCWGGSAGVVGVLGVSWAAGWVRWFVFCCVVFSPVFFGIQGRFGFVMGASHHLSSCTVWGSTFRDRPTRVFHFFCSPPKCRKGFQI